jgi:hypothetical protein
MMDNSVAIRANGTKVGDRINHILLVGFADGERNLKE